MTCILCAADRAVERGCKGANVVAPVLVRIIAGESFAEHLVGELCQAHRRTYAEALTRFAIQQALGE